MALDRATLVAVPSLCALSLVIALPLGARLTDQHVDRRAVTGALLALAGIVAFVVTGQPAGGSATPGASVWVASAAVALVLMALLGRSARRRGGAVAAALFATAAGICFAYQAAVTKVFVNHLGSGLGAILTNWTTYALILSALAGFALQQSALKTGYLAPAMAASNAATLLGSVLLGVWIFEETLASGGQRLIALVALGAAVVGVITLATPRRAPGSGPDRPGEAEPESGRSALE